MGGKTWKGRSMANPVPASPLTALAVMDHGRYRNTAPYSVQRTVCAAQCTLCTVYTIHYALYTGVQCKLYSIQQCYVNNMMMP